MATSPTVLAGVSSSSVPRKPSVVSLLIAVVAGMLISALGVGGAMYYLARSGRLPGQSGMSAKEKAPVPVVTRAIDLEPLLVNLADEGGSSYLKVALTLRVAEASNKTDSKNRPKDGDDAIAAVRDTTLTVLGQETAERLLAVDGKEHLKAELKSALAKHNEDLKVIEIFFTDFLVQR